MRRAALNRALGFCPLSPLADRPGKHNGDIQPSSNQLEKRSRPASRCSFFGFFVAALQDEWQKARELGWTAMDSIRGMALQHPQTGSFSNFFEKHFSM